MTPYTWIAVIAVAWLAVVWWLSGPLGRMFAAIWPPPEHPAPQPPTPPTAGVPGPRLPPVPPAAALDWVTDERRLGGRCGCVHVIDHIARTRVRYPCKKHAFDLDHWEQRYQES